jgi:2-iminobutanoate/2-iminopropanoate deaminase
MSSSGRRDASFPDGLVRPKAPYSPVVRSGDHVYTAGQVAFGADGQLVAGDIAQQTTKALANLELCLRAAGCTLGDVVKVNVFLADLTEFEEFNAVYREAFDEPYPARTTVQAGLPSGIRVEIEAVARIPGAT